MKRCVDVFLSFAFSSGDRKDSDWRGACRQVQTPLIQLSKEEE